MTAVAIFASVSHCLQSQTTAPRDEDDKKDARHILLLHTRLTHR